MRSFDIFVTLCGAVIASYAAMGFPRKMVLLCSIPPLSLLFLANLFLTLPLNLYGWLLLGTLVCLATAWMYSEKHERLLTFSAALLCAETALAFQQLWLLCQYFDAILAQIIQITLMVGGVYAALSGRLRLVNRERWQLLWDSASEKDFRARQIWIVLAQLFQTAILIAMAYLTSGIAMAGLWLSVFAFFAIGMYVAFSYSLMISEVSYLEDAQEASQRFFHAIRSQRHDFLIHVHTICGLLSSNQIDACREYTEKLSEEVRRSNEVIPLDDPAVSALISDYIARAEQQGISIICSIKHDMKQIACSAFELNRVLGNMLQNAMEEVTQYKAPNRWMELLVMKRAGRSVIKVTNPFLRDPDSLTHAAEMNISTKPSHEGIGLKNIERIAKKYDGAFFIELDGQKISIVVQIPDRINQSEDGHENFSD